MDYFNVDHMGAAQSFCRERRCGGVKVQRVLLFVVAFFTFFLFCGFLLKVFPPLKPFAAPSNTQNNSASSGQPRRSMAAPGLTDYRGAMVSNTLDTAARGFILAWNEPRGFLLLKCDKKAGKGVHFQLPGGHVDSSQDIAASTAPGAATFSSTTQQTVPPPTAISAGVGVVGPTASYLPKILSTEDLARTAAARELWEETGIDVRTEVDRLVPLSGLGVGPLKKNRYYFFLNLTDFLIEQAVKLATAEGGNLMPATARKGLDAPSPPQVELVSPQRVLVQEEEVAASGSQVTNTPSKHIRTPVKLPIGIAEHSGFRFVADSRTAAELVTKHSGGCSTVGLLQFYRAVVNSPPEILAAHGINIRLQ